MARFTKDLLAKRDDPIYREGLTVFTPYTARWSRRRPAPPPTPYGPGSPWPGVARGPLPRVFQKALALHIDAATGPTPDQPVGVWRRHIGLE